MLSVTMSPSCCLAIDADNGDDDDGDDDDNDDDDNHDDDAVNDDDDAHDNDEDATPFYPDFGTEDDKKTHSQYVKDGSKVFFFLLINFCFALVDSCFI